MAIVNSSTPNDSDLQDRLIERDISAFISYSWEEQEHNEWVHSLADRLLNDGIEALIDEYDLKPGESIPQFMEKSVPNSDFVLVICTPTYKEKSDSRIGGVGYESHIISAEILEKSNKKKFIPILRKDEISNSLPKCLAGSKVIDLRDGIHYEKNYRDLIAVLKGISKKPPVNKKAREGSKPHQFTNAKCNDEQDNEPVKILGIITDQVTVPRMDGSLGSALYKIPFKLSKKPSNQWKDLFLKAWDSPPRFSTMHRPGIASVVGDEIILDGTTIEEVRDYHRDTLEDCVNIANQKEKDIIEKKKKNQEQEEKLKNAHYDKVESIADSIKF